MNSIVYPVDGGMEDWAYAGQWDRANNRNCLGREKNAQSSENGYGAAVFLVETSDLKRPTPVSLGSTRHVLNSSSSSNGHIPRNVRLALAAIDILQPYVCIRSVRESPGRNRLTISWSVGGVSSVDGTWLALHVANEEHATNLPHNFQRPGSRRQVFPLRAGDFVANLTGIVERTRIARGSRGVETVFTASVSYSSIVEAATDNRGAMQDGNVRWLLVAWAAVDGHWAAAGQGFPTNLMPQTLLVSARTGSTQKSSSSEFPNTDRELGRLWSSHPVQVSLSNDVPWNYSRLFLRGTSEKGVIQVRSLVTNCAVWKPLFRPSDVRAGVFTVIWKDPLAVNLDDGTLVDETRSWPLLFLIIFGCIAVVLIVVLVAKRRGGSFNIGGSTKMT
jgi:hypothetical protein